jgi:molybdate transport system ATP-binding protein
VLDNLLYARRRADSKLSLSEVTALLGLDRLLKRSTVHLSGGERQRVALGRALLSEPQILLLDEPLSGLDPQNKAEIITYLETILRTHAIPALYVTHDLREVDRLADRVLIMEQGKVRTPPAAPGDTRRLLAGLSAAERDELAAAALKAGLGSPLRSRG